MNWLDAPLLTPDHGGYALIALAVICAIGWIVTKMLTYPEPIVDPYEREHQDV